MGRAPGGVIDEDGRGAVKQDAAPSALPLVYVTDALLAKTAELLASFALEQEAEGVVYWFGLELGAAAVVTTLIVPKAVTATGCVFTSPEANAEVLTAIVGTPLVLLGQAHSHPRNKVRHSRVDDRETFARFDGAISVVVPYFARRGMDVRRCGVHRHIAGAFRLIGRTELGEHLVVIPGEIDVRKGRSHLLLAYERTGK